MEVEIIKDIFWAGGRDSEDTGKQKLFKVNENYFVASQVNLGHDSYGDYQWETMVFAANEEGSVNNWTDLWCTREVTPTDIEVLIHKAVKSGD